MLDDNNVFAYTFMARDRFYPFHEWFSRYFSRWVKPVGHEKSVLSQSDLNLLGGPTRVRREQTRDTPHASPWVKRLLRLSRFVIYDAPLKPTATSLAVLGFGCAQRRSPAICFEHLLEKIERHWAQTISRSLDFPRFGHLLIGLPPISRWNKLYYCSYHD